MAGLRLGVVRGAEVTDVTGAPPGVGPIEPGDSGSGSAARVKWR